MYDQQEIVQRISSSLNDPQNAIQGSFCMDNISAVAQELSRLYYMEILTIPDKVFEDTAEAENLDRVAARHSLIRNQATKASGIVEFSGREGVIIPQGTKVSAGEILFSTVVESVIPYTLKISAEVICDSPGTIGNVPAGSIDKTIGIYNLLVTNRKQIEGGYEEETDSNLRSRILEKIQKPYTSGNQNDYIRWARQIAGVGNAICIPLWNGNGTVKVVILDTRGDAPADAVIDRVEDYIDTQKPIGANVTITKAIPKQVNIKANVKIVNGYKIEDILMAFEKSLTAYLIQNPFGLDTKCLSYYKISDLLFSCTGIQDVIDYTINDQMNSLTAEKEEFFKINEVNINEVE